MKALLLIAAGGALGAVSRSLVSSWVDRSTDHLAEKLPVAPLGTLVANVVGSLVIGIVLGLASARGALADPVRAFAIVGFLGSFTTFSTFSYHTFELFRNGHHVHAFGNIALNVLLTIAFVALGFFGAERLSGHPN